MTLTLRCGGDAGIRSTGRDVCERCGLIRVETTAETEPGVTMATRAIVRALGLHKTIAKAERQIAQAQKQQAATVAPHPKAEAEAEMEAEV
jgi:hypothetical protein